MLSTNIPKPKVVADVTPGSLVLVPGLKRWGISMGGDGIFFFHNFRPSGQVNGKVADFGRAYDIQLDLLTASRALHPWVEDEVGHGDLMLFSLANGSTTTSIALGGDIHGQQLHTFEINTGRMVGRGRDDGEGLAYKSWRIDFHLSSRDVEVATIFSWPLPEQ